MCLWGFRTRKDCSLCSQILKQGLPASMGHKATEEWLSEELSSESIKHRGYLLTVLYFIEKEGKIHYENEILSVTPIGLPTN